MNSKHGILAYVIGVAALFGGLTTAKADIMLALVREPGPTANTDAVSLYALGSEGDATLVSYKVSLQDLTSAGLVMGNYQVTTGLPNSKGFYTDITGSQAAVASSLTALNATDAYTWIGNGQYNPTGFFTAVRTPDTNTGGLEADVSSGPWTTSGANPYFGPLTGLHVEGGWTTPVDASAATGGTGNGDGALLAVAVVPHNDAVNMFGQIGGSATTATFNLTSGTASVPEPASLSALAFGGLALIIRRRKA